MKLILILSIFLLVSNFSSTKNHQKIGLTNAELCPNLGQIPAWQVPNWAIYKKGNLKNEVVVFSPNGNKLLIPLQFISNAKGFIHAEKDWLNFSKLYLEVCGDNPPFPFWKKVSLKSHFKNLLERKNEKVSSRHFLEGVGKLLHVNRKHLLLEGKVIYSPTSSSSLLLENGIFLVKNYKNSIPKINTLLKLNLRYVGDVYDSSLKMRVPVYKYLY